jgi:cytochrome c biogenesis protein CcmG, thiol:disulfide interchange protein DsbE
MERECKMSPGILFRNLAIILSLCPLAYGSDVRVTFHVTVPGVLSPLSTVYVSSSRNGWSARSPVWKMRQAGENAFQLDIDIPDGEKIEYHYTLGDPECVEAARDGKPAQNRVFVARGGVVRRDTVGRWTMESVNAGHWLAADVYNFQYQWLVELWGLSPLESLDASNPLRNLRSVAQLDSVVTSTQREWRKIAEAQYGGVAPELLSACYEGLLKVPQQGALYPMLQDYLVEYYMAPALIREYPELKASPSKQKARMLSTPLITLQFALRMNPFSSPPDTSFTEIPGLSSLAARRQDQWKKLSAIEEDWSGLIEEYLADSSLTGEKEQPGLLALKLIIEYLRPCWKIQEELNKGRTADAVRAVKQMSADGSRSVPAQEIARTARAVFRECVQKNMSADALDVADICAVQQSRLSPQTTAGISYLRSMYLEADSLRGEARYNAAAVSSSIDREASPSLNGVPQPLLTGRFLDLTSGDTLDLATLRGKIVVIDFWTTWCGTCVSQIPFLKKYAGSLRSTPEVAFISVLCDPTTWDRGQTFTRKFVSAQNVNYPVLADHRNDPLNRRLSISWYPSSLVIGRDGAIALTPQGSGTWSKVEECVAALQSR